MYYVGEAFVYSTATNALIATLYNPTPATLDYFGASVAVSGNYVVIGAYQDDTGATNSGSAYIYDMSSATPTVPILTLNNPTPANNDYFGYSVSVSGKYVVIGAEDDNTGAMFAGSAYVYDLTTVTPTTPIFTLNNPTPAFNDSFGNAVAVSGNYVVIGAIYDDTGATDAGSAYVYNLSSATPTVPAVTLNNPSPASADYFGTSVAVSGKYVVVGADHDDTGAPDAGSAYVYDLTSTTPAQPWATLNDPTSVASAFFGYSVAVSPDYVVVGAEQDKTGTIVAGRAYVYALSSLPANTSIVINDPAPATGDFFGNAVAVSGNSVVVGALLDDAGTTNAGSAYVYAVTPSTANFVTALINPSPAAGDLFGSSVAVSGNIVVVGAPQDDTGAANAGAAYVYDFNSATPTIPIAFLANPTPAPDDNFGNAVAVSGKYVVVGAYLHGSGSAYLFDLTSSPPGALIGSFNNPTPVMHANFGVSVAISGTTVVVGADKDATSSTSAGGAYIYDLSSATPTIPIITLNNPAPSGGATAGHYFGISVAASGKYVVVGASENSGFAPAGAAYVFDLTSITPATPIITLNNPTPASLDFFGIAVAVAGKYAVVGADQDDTGATDAGSAYVYDLTAATPNVPIATLNNPSPANADNFGNSVSVSGNTVVIGAYQDDTGAIDAGSAYIYNLTSATPNNPVATLNNPTLGNGEFFGNAVAASGKYVVIGANYADTQNFNQGAVYEYTLAAPQVGTVQINGGDVQRSRVTSVAVTFDQSVYFTGSPAAAFQLKRQSDNQTVTLNAAVNGNTVTLTFVGGAVESGSLADGRYILTIDAGQVFNSNGKLDGNGDGVGGDNYVLASASAPNPPTNIFRLFGDANGDGTVSAEDFQLIRVYFASSNIIFDFDGDGYVSASDFIQFRLRFGGSI
jgi:hypothetical protein